MILVFPLVFDMEMKFNENLIEKVRNKVEIWDIKAKNHKNSEHLRRLWEEVASELEVDGEFSFSRIFFSLIIKFPLGRVYSRIDN